MELRRFDDAEAFLEAAGPFLVADEPRHNLELGILSQLRANPMLFGEPAYLAAVHRDGRIAGIAIRTPPFNLLVSASDVAGVGVIAPDVYERFSRLPGVLSTPEIARGFAEAWTAVSGQPHRPGMRQRIYRLDDVPEEPRTAGRMRMATEADRSLLLRWMEDFRAEAMPSQAPASVPGTVDHRLTASDAGLELWDDPGPVSMAGFTSPTPTGIRIGPVYTPPEYRRRGYGTACTAALSRMLMLRGYRTCFLYTDLANPTSNSIYTAIGYRMVCDMLEVRFEERGSG
jgi:predicted GNAT family acetyltransferase